MIRNSPYTSKSKALVSLVTTPIGNLSDITYRAIDTLKEADIIACEDTRNTSFLLNHYNILNKKLISLYAQTEAKQAKEIVAKIKKEGLKLAYCSDAGMPGISDPGSLLVLECYKQEVPVTLIPGPTASLSGLVLSGFDSADFTFLGFLPTKVGAIKEQLEGLKNRKETLIFYESPKRILKTLKVFLEVLGENREVAIVRELTKIHEEVIRGSLKEITSSLTEIKGECIIVVKGNEAPSSTIDEKELEKIIKRRIKEGESISTIVKDLSTETKIKKNLIYKIALGVK